MFDPVRRLAADQGGASAVILALALPMLMLATGGAIDFSRAASKRQTIANGLELSCRHAALVLGHRGNITAGDSQFVNETANTRLASLEISDAGVSSTVAEGTITIRAASSSANVFASLLNIETVALSVQRSCTITVTEPPKELTPTEISFKLDYARGTWWKRVSLWVRRPDGREVQLGSITYHATHYYPGTVTGSLDKTLVLGEYDSVFLKMEYSTDGCPPGQVPKDAWTCVPQSSTYKKYGKVGTLRTDDLSTSQHLYVDGKQVAKNTKFTTADLFDCDRPVKHEWEDGGGWSAADIGFTVTASKCTDKDRAS
jgi:Flp pilus assembly protein TadG